MVAGPTEASVLLRSQIVNTLQTQEIFQGYELPLEKAFAASTWDEFVAVLDPMQDFAYYRYNVSAYSKEAGTNELIRFSYGLGDNEFGSFHRANEASPLIAVSDGDLYPNCWGRNLMCGKQVGKKLLDCLDLD